MAKSTTPRPKKAAAGADKKSSVRTTMEQNPVAFAAGGLAIGLVAGMLIPRSEREKAALKAVGQRIAEGAGAAVAAAKETGKEHLSASVLSKDAVKESARAVLNSAVSAAKAKKSA